MIQIQQKSVPFLAGLTVAPVGMLVAYSLELGSETARRLFRKSASIMTISMLAGILLVFASPKGIRPDAVAILNAVIAGASQSALIAGRRVEAHWWDDTRGKTLILRLQYSGWRRLVSPVPLLAPAHLKNEVDSVMRRYMGEFPER